MPPAVRKEIAEMMGLTAEITTPMQACSGVHQNTPYMATAHSTAERATSTERNVGIYDREPFPEAVLLSVAVGGERTRDAEQLLRSLCEKAVKTIAHTVVITVTLEGNAKKQTVAKIMGQMAHVATFPPKSMLVGDASGWPEPTVTDKGQGNEPPKQTRTVTDNGIVVAPKVHRGNDTVRHYQRSTGGTTLVYCSPARDQAVPQPTKKQLADLAWTLAQTCPDYPGSHKLSPEWHLKNTTHDLALKNQAFNASNKAPKRPDPRAPARKCAWADRGGMEYPSETEGSIDEATAHTAEQQMTSVWPTPETVVRDGIVPNTYTAAMHDAGMTGAETTMTATRIIRDQAHNVVVMTRAHETALVDALREIGLMAQKKGNVAEQDDRANKCNT